MNGRKFTLIELVVVISIIASLLGITFVSVNMAKSKAKYTKWLTYNTMLSKDPDTVLNFNFIDTQGRAMYPVGNTQQNFLVLSNTAVACNIPGFELRSTHGIIRNATWVIKGGRSRFHNAIQFDGRTSFVEIPNSTAIDFDPEKDEFTIMLWARFDSISSTRVLCGKAEWNPISQYTVYLTSNRLEADVGRFCTGWRTPVIAVNRWYHIALVSEGGGRFQLYLNGYPMTSPINGSASSQTKTSSPLLLGAVFTTANRTTPRYHFQGRMDEFVLIRKALKPAEIKHHYDAGNYK